jgi:DNA-binding response OmpR family regulator
MLRFSHGSIRKTFRVMRILLVEDEARMAQAIKRGLRQAAYAVDVARDGEDALYQFTINDYDAVILDVMLPKRNGFEVCRELRRGHAASHFRSVFQLTLPAPQGRQNIVRE